LEVTKNLTSKNRVNCVNNLTISKKKALELWFGGKFAFGVCLSAIYLNGFVDGVRKYIKIIPCNKSYCKVCGKAGSLAHRQRFARGLNKILGSNYLGYFVFTFPKEVRSKFMDTRLLNDFQNFIKELLRGYPFVVGGVSCWHWSGDKSGGWNPHLNVVVSVKNGLISKAILQSIRARVLWWVYCNIKIELETVVIHYQYNLKPVKKVHIWKYVTRPTMLNCGEKLLCVLPDLLYNYRNVRWFGQWNKCPDKMLGEGSRVLSDESIEWRFGSSLKNIYVELLSEDWEYKGYGIFYYNSRASP